MSELSTIFLLYFVFIVVYCCIKNASKYDNYHLAVSQGQESCSIPGFSGAESWSLKRLQWNRCLEIQSTKVCMSLENPLQARSCCWRKEISVHSVLSPQGCSACDQLASPHHPTSKWYTARRATPRRLWVTLYLRHIAVWWFILFVRSQSLGPAYN